MGFVDLHVHSNASDGTFSPSQVVELAKMLLSVTKTKNSNPTIG